MACCMEKVRKILNMKNGTKIVMSGILMSIMILINGCAAAPDAEETIMTQLQDEDRADNEADGAISGGDLEDNDANEIIEESKANIELSDELKEEFTSELLKYKNMDTSILSSSKKTQGCTFELPEGFEESEDVPGMYLNEHYPVDAATIYYAISDKDTALQLMSENTFKENMESELEQTYGYDVKLNIESFENIKIDGFVSFRILYTYTNNDINFTQLQYIINADKTYVITYSQTEEYDRMTEFAQSAETIRVE